MPEVVKAKKLEKSRESTPANDEDGEEKTAEQSGKKKKERKVPEKKVKPEGQRKKVVKKSVESRVSGSASEGSDRPRQKAVIRKLPLSARQIYHGRSWVPMTRFGEGESEEECECSWVMDYTGHKLEDIVDLNAAEKAMMNLWNKHVNKYQGRGMAHMDVVVMDFLGERSHTIVELNLYRNFVSHLVTLHQANVLTGETMYRAIGHIQDVMRVLDETATVVVPVWEEQQRRALARVREEQEPPAASSPSRMVSSLLGGLATVVTLMVRSAGRCRPNSTLAGGGRPSTASPGQASPGRGAPSPSRPSTSSSIGRGRRSSNWSKHVQKSLELEPRSLDFDLPSPPTSETFHLANQTTPKRKGREGREGAAPGTDSGADTSASEAGREVASFLTTFPTINAEDKEEEEDFEVHVLTEEPDSEDLEEEVEEAEMEDVEEEAEAAAETVHRRSSRVVGLGEQEKDFGRLQEEERRSTLEKAREKDPGGIRVAVIYIGDELIQFAEDRLVTVVEECPRVTALRNLYMKQQLKRKGGREGSGQAAKRARLE